MNLSTADYRKAQNEVIFRMHNEAIQVGFDEISRVAEEDNQKDLIPANGNTLLRFYCECADENCRLRILLTPNGYNRLHKRADHFVIAPGHETKRIEKVIRRSEDYYVVEKELVPPVANADLSLLNPTDTNNV
jgi:hypothetical protein